MYVALARSVGLEAWIAHIERTAGGYPGYHDCAALFVEGQGLLVDPTWRSFGIGHEVFIVLDDLQAISHHAMQFPGGSFDARRLRAGLKLNPDDRWTQLQFVRGMAKSGDHAAAEAELRKVRSAGVESWDVHEAAAELEMAREHWQAALVELQLALTLSPSNAIVHAQLANVHLQLNDPVKSREHIEAALRFDRGEVPAKLRRESPAHLAMLDVLAQGESSNPASLDELKQRAEAGEVAAQFALAKICFDAAPPRTEEGMAWLRKAAAQGDANAQVNYARNLLGWRGKAAAEEVAVWLARSAGQGNTEAQYRLGLLLYDGKLVKRDNVAAGQWVLLASSKGNVEAKRLFREMELFLNAEELAEARRRANAFQPSAGKSPSANNP